MLGALLLLAATLVLPLLATMALGGFGLVHALEDPSSGPRQQAYAALAFTVIPLGLALVGGLLGSGRTMPWELLGSLPITKRALFAVELFASAFDLITALELAAFAALVLGGGLGQEPSALPALLLLWLYAAGMLLALQQAVASFAQRASRHLRGTLIFLVVLSLSWRAWPPPCWFEPRATPGLSWHGCWRAWGP